uniref:Uncharacterized protein n=1 Tax=Arundo donax TaxID=35708 RepID=A0A0A8ZUV2_ARUDO
MTINHIQNRPFHLYLKPHMHINKHVKSIKKSWSEHQRNWKFQDLFVSISEAKQQTCTGH